MRRIHVEKQADPEQEAHAATQGMSLDEASNSWLRERAVLGAVKL